MLEMYNRLNSWVGSLYIRQEQPMDYDTIYQIIKEAFTNVEHSHGNEQDLVIQLRNRLKYVSRLADWKIRI